VSSRDRFELNITSETSPQPSRERDENVFRIAFVGDFSGRAESSGAAPKAVLVDPDNFDTVLKEVGVLIDTPAGRLPIEELDDFHPDRMLAKLPGFRQLRESRKRLETAESSAEAAREVLGERTAPRMPASGGDLLEQMLGGRGAAAAPQPSRPGDELHDFIQRSIRPYLEPGQDPRAAELVEKLDRAATAQKCASFCTTRSFRHSRPRGARSICCCGGWRLAPN
jgi:predicted component of type VI protein secretion system